MNGFVRSCAHGVSWVAIAATQAVSRLKHSTLTHHAAHSLITTHPTAPTVPTAHTTHVQAALGESQTVASQPAHVPGLMHGAQKIQACTTVLPAQQHSVRVDRIRMTVPLASVRNHTAQVPSSPGPWSAPSRAGSSDTKQHIALLHLHIGCCKHTAQAVAAAPIVMSPQAPVQQETPTLLPRLPPSLPR
jgi:hypothetical protein